MYISSWINSPFQGSGWTRINRPVAIPNGPTTPAEKFLQGIFRLGETLVIEGISSTVGEINPFVAGYFTEKFQEGAEQFIENDLISIHRQLKPYQRRNEWGLQSWFNQFVDYLVDNPSDN